SSTARCALGAPSMPPQRMARKTNERTSATSIAVVSLASPQQSDSRASHPGPRGGGLRQCYDRAMNPELRARGYLPAKGLLEPRLPAVVYKTLLLHQWRGECYRDNHVPTAATVVNTAMTDALLLELRPRIEAVAGSRIVPTYSYARV